MKGKHYSDRAIVAANQNVKEKEFWLKELSGEPVKSRFPYDNDGFPIKEGENHKLEKETFRFSENLSSKSITLSSDIDLKLHMILVAGLVLLLEKYTGTGDIVIGSPVLKQDMEGEFINTILVFRTRLGNPMTFKDLLGQVKETIVTATKNQNFPLEVLPDLLNMPVFESEFPLFDVVLMLENIHDKSYLEGIHYNMLFSFNRLGNGIEGSLEYNSLLYREPTVKQIVNHYTRLLEKGLSDLNGRLVDIDILSEQERHRLLKEFNAKKMDFPKDKTFHQLFEEQAERRADSIAAVAHSEIHMTYMTYKELNEKSNQLARLLKEKGVKPDTIVAIMTDRSIEMIVGVIGIIKAGGAYLPIDPDYPDERKRYILSDSNARILITARNLTEGIVFEKEIIYLENYKKPAASLESSFHAPCSMPQASQASVSLAYVIYTSGSTGKPKGVMVQHNHFVNVGMGWQKEYRLQEIEVNLLQIASFSFDVFAGDLARTFLNGGKMVISPESVLDPESLYQLIISHRVTLFESTPSYIFSFMDHVYENNLPINSLQLLILGSDTCPVRDFKKMLTRFGKQMRIINSYGVTEATIDSSYYELRTEEQLPSISSVPIGKPLPNVKYYILDRAGNPLPRGVPGELYIGGESVTRGYLNNPELTAAKVTSLPLYPSTSLYRTGDLARWLPDGNVEFLGRMDYQVKVRGYRIELGEVENKLLEHIDIKEAAVVEKITENNDKYLCGYVTSDKNMEPAELRNFLEKKLPDYMVPWFFVQLEQLPLTSNGKIDRKALPEPETSGEVEYVAPRSETEKKLVELWSQVFGGKKEDIGIKNNFFALGGTSFKAIILLAKMNQNGFPITFSDIFHYQTIEDLSRYLLSMRENKGLLQARKEVAQYLRKSTGIAFEWGCYPTSVSKNEMKEYSILYGDFFGKNNFATVMNLLRQNVEKKILPHYIIDKQNKIRLGKKDKIGEAELFTILGLEDFRDEDIHEIEAVLQQDYAHNNAWLKQGEVLNEYSLSPIQKLQIAFRTPVSFGYFLLDEYVDDEIFKEAYIRVIKKQDLLRSIAIKKEAGFYWRVYDYNFNDSPRLSVIDLTRYNVPLNAFMKICGKITQRIFERGDIFYHIIMMRKNLRENYLIMLFNHVIFDRVTEEIMRRELLTHYHSLLKGQSVNVNVKDNEGETYEKYVTQIHKGPQHITEQEVIEHFYLEDFFNSKKQLKEIMQTNRVGHTTYTLLIKVPLKEQLKDKQPIEVALSLYGRTLQRYTGVDKIPLLFVYEGRQYCENMYYSTIGEFIDMVPMVLDPALKPEELLHSVQERVDYLKKHNINFLNLVVNKEFAEKWRQTVDLVDHGKNFDNIDVAMYNFLGNSEDDTGDSFDDGVRQEPNPLPIDTLFNCIAFNYKGGFIFTIRCSCEIDFKTLKEMFHQVAEELYT